MKLMSGVFGAVAQISLVLLVCGVAGAAGRGNARDVVYRSSALDGRQLATVAVLPVVSVTGNPVAERQVEVGWVTLYQEANVRWMPADDVRARLSGYHDSRGDLEAAVREQIWRSGTVDSVTAVRLARLLGVDVLLTVIVDRWEIADGGRAMVELAAVFTGSDGRRLMSIHGLAAEGAARPSGTWNHPTLEPRDGRQKLSRAYRKLLARWVPALPTGFGDGFPDALLADRDS